MAIEKREGASLTCSFCGKAQKEVKKLIAGPTVYICDECIGLCNDIIAEEIEKEDQSYGSSSIPKPAPTITAATTSPPTATCRSRRYSSPGCFAPLGAPCPIKATSVGTS